MSVVNARYAGTCYTCGAATEVGERVHWARGQGVRHVNTAACEEAVDNDGTSCCGDYHYADCPSRGGSFADSGGDPYGQDDEHYYGGF